MKTSRIAAVLTAGSLAAGTLALQPAMAAGVTVGSHTVSANIGAVSNYVWRGQTQTGDDPAIQGGFDYKHDSGFYAGVWASNVDFDTVSGDPSYELDVYTGFSNSINDDFSYDIGVLAYTYPDGRDDANNFAEVDVSGTYKWLTLGIAYTFASEADSDEVNTQGDIYYHAALDFDLPVFELGFSIYGGYYDFRYDDGGNDYGNWGASLSRDAGDFGTFSLNYDQISRDNGSYDTDPTVWVGWNKEF